MSILKRNIFGKSFLKTEKNTIIRIPGWKVFMRKKIHIRKEHFSRKGNLIFTEKRVLFGIETFYFEKNLEIFETTWSHLKWLASSHFFQFPIQWHVLWTPSRADVGQCPVSTEVVWESQLAAGLTNLVMTRSLYVFLESFAFFPGFKMFAECF